MKKKFTAGTMLIVALALLITGVAGACGLYLREVDAARQSLHELLTLVDSQESSGDPAGMARRFAAAAPDKRLTLIAPDGTVLADTGSDTAENHADRPEVRSALATGWGEITRSSETLGVPMLYVAKRLSDGSVARAAMALSSIDSLVLSAVPALLLAALIALLLSLPLSSRLAGQLLKPLGAVGTAIQEVLDGGEGQALKQYDSDDELRPMLRYIRQLVDRLGDDLRQIKAERDKVSLILDCMDEGLILLDEDGNVLAMNRAARDLLNLPVQGGESARILLRSKAVREGLATSARQGSPAVVDLPPEDPDGKQLRLFLSSVSGRQYEGQQVGSTVLISDVTALKRAENVRSQFAANVSHELKTPLTSIKGFTEMLSGGMVKNEEDRQRFLTLIGVEVDRLISLINDILELSALEDMTIDSPSETASPLEEARQAQSLLAAEAGKRGVALSVSGAEGEARISSDRLRELLLNLMENAVKYSKEAGGKVDVTVDRAEDNFVIKVADNGIGIPPEAQEHVFERFYRVDKGRSRQSGGTGLGLAIVKHIVQLYGGTVSLDSQVGVGSAFTVTLPTA